MKSLVHSPRIGRDARVLRPSSLALPMSEYALFKPCRVRSTPSLSPCGARGAFYVVVHWIPARGPVLGRNDAPRVKHLRELYIVSLSSTPIPRGERRRPVPSA